MRIQLGFEGQIKLGAELEVGEGPTRTINVSFIGVHGFFPTQSRIWCIVRSTSFFVSHTMRALPLVFQRMSIF